MELPILFVFLTSFIVNISSHPKNSDIIPKDYYKRQILQPIPGYIPVYIKADGEPLVRRESKKPIANIYSQKAAEPKEKNFSARTETKSSSENEKSGTRTEGGTKNWQNPLQEVQDEPELVKAKSNQNEGNDKVSNSQVKLDFE